MKIAVYAIALNEEQFVKSWYESAKEADYLLIADTGSSDATVAQAKKLGINVVSINIKPWRFDDARNASLAAIPLDIDYCIALDMDEQLQPGWREDMETVPEGATRIRYKYVWSWNADGSEGLVYGGDKIHARQSYRWKHPVHEVITNYLNPETQHWLTKLEIHHHPDDTKSRGQYFPMLEMAVAEDPSDDRNAHYLAREYYFHGMCEKAIAEFKRHLSLPKATWNVERAASMRYLAKCSQGVDKENWFKMAAQEAPGSREPFVDLASYYYDNNMWAECKEAAVLALAITEKPLDYLNDAEAWGAKPHDLAAIASYHLGHKEDAQTYGKQALTINPQDERLKKNLEFYNA